MSSPCSQLHHLIHSLPRFYFPFDVREIPQNGIYILFENGEGGHGKDRIVRVGTHTGENQLRSRLRQHFINENKDRSIFRKNIGRCLLHKENDPYLSVWELDCTSPEQKARFRSLLDMEYQQEIEQRVTQYIQTNFSFCVLEVQTKEERIALKSKLISTMATCPECRPSKNWLGNYSPKNKIRDSGLWQVNELNKEPLSSFDLTNLGEAETMTSKLCIVPCGSSKIWNKQPSAGPTQAQYVYTGPFAAACQRYAKANFTNWVILSAKHGFLYPEDTVHEPYNVSFVKPSDETMDLRVLKEQAADKGLLEYQEITVLGGRHYIERAKAIFNQGQKIILPLSDCKGIGYMLQKLKNALPENNPTASSPVTTIEEAIVRNKMESPVQKAGKYEPLFHFLCNCKDQQVSFTIDELETLLGFTLPSSAYNHLAWWSNSLSHSQAYAWLQAGWKVQHVHLPTIVFTAN